MSKAWSEGSSPQWRRLRAYVLRRDGYVCRIGGPKCTERADCVDHIEMLSMGGAKYDESNCRAACTPCNRGREIPKPQPEPEPLRISDW